MLKTGGLLVVSIIWACNLAPDDCSGVGRDGLVLVVADSTTGTNLNALATVTVSQLTAPFETRTGPIAGPPSPLDLASRPGPYRVSVAVDGYQPWERVVTVVQTGDPCAEIVTLTVTAQLVPSG